MKKEFITKCPKCGSRKYFMDKSGRHCPDCGKSPLQSRIDELEKRKRYLFNEEKLELKILKLFKQYKD
jgi:predicted  nucleic acid-binding Zn-ribbon protein